MILVVNGQRGLQVELRPDDIIAVLQPLVAELTARMSPDRFRPFTRADLPMAARWLRTPELVRWWGDPERELTLLSQHLGEPAMRQWIVEHRDRPFACVQGYRAGA